MSRIGISRGPRDIVNLRAVLPSAAALASRGRATANSNDARPTRLKAGELSCGRSVGSLGILHLSVASRLARGHRAGQQRPADSGGWFCRASTLQLDRHSRVAVREPAHRRPPGAGFQGYSRGPRRGAGRSARRSAGHATACAFGPLCPERAPARRFRPSQTAGHGFVRSTDDTHSGCPCTSYR